MSDAYSFGDGDADEDEIDEIVREMGGEAACSSEEEEEAVPTGFYPYDAHDHIFPVCAAWETREEDYSYAFEWVRKWKRMLPAREFMQEHKGWLWALYFTGPLYSCVYLPHVWTSYERMNRLNDHAGLLYIQGRFPIPGKIGLKFVSFIHMGNSGDEPSTWKMQHIGSRRSVRTSNPDAFFAWIGARPPYDDLCPMAELLRPASSTHDLYTFGLTRVNGRADFSLDYDGAAEEVFAACDRYLAAAEEGKEPDDMPAYGPQRDVHYVADSFVTDYAAIMTQPIPYRKRWLSQRILVSQGNIFLVVARSGAGWGLVNAGPMLAFFQTSHTLVQVSPTSKKQRKINISQSVKEALPGFWEVTVIPNAPSYDNGVVNVFQPFAFRSFKLERIDWRRFLPFLVEYTERLHRGNWDEARMSLCCFGWFFTHPSQCLEMMPIFRNTNGVGKSTFLRLLQTVGGLESTKVYDHASALFKQFNWSSVSVLLHMVDENTFSSTDFGALKSRITARSFDVEAKGKDSMRIDVPRAYVLACNNVEDLKVDIEERRVLAFEGMRADVKRFLVDGVGWRSVFHNFLSDDTIVQSFALFITKYLDLSYFERQKGTMYPTAELHRMRVHALPKPEKNWVACCKVGVNHLGHTKGVRENWLERVPLCEFTQLCFLSASGSRDMSWIRHYGLCLDRASVVVPDLKQCRSFVSSRVHGWTADDCEERQVLYRSNADFDELFPSNSAEMKRELGRLSFFIHPSNLLREVFSSLNDEYQSPQLRDFCKRMEDEALLDIPSPPLSPRTEPVPGGSPLSASSSLDESPTILLSATPLVVPNLCAPPTPKQPRRRPRSTGGVQHFPIASDLYPEYPRILRVSCDSLPPVPDEDDFAVLAQENSTPVSLPPPPPPPSPPFSGDVSLFADIGVGDTPPTSPLAEPDAQEESWYVDARVPGTISPQLPTHPRRSRRLQGEAVD